MDSSTNALDVADFPIAQALGETETVELAKKVPLDTELGVSMNLPFAGGYDNNEIFNPQEVPVEELMKMRQQDGQVRALVRIITLPIRAAGWTIIPNGGDEEAEFINNVFSLPPQSGGMTVSTNKFIRQTLLAVVEGFSLFYKKRTIPDKGPNTGKIVYAKLCHRPASTITFKADKYGGFDGARQRTHFLGQTVDVSFLPEDLWYWCVNEEENPFYGMSMFLPTYYHWDKKRKLYYLMHLAAQFDAVPGRKGTYPKTAAIKQIERFQAAMKQFGVNTAITMEEGFILDEFKQSSKFEWIKAIDHHNSMMSKSLLAQFIDLGQQEGKGSSYALSEDQSDLFVMAEDAIMSEIEEQISHHLIPELIDLNFGSDNYPTFKFNPITDANRKIIEDLMIKFSTAASTQLTPETIFEIEVKMAERMGLKIDVEAMRKEFEEKREKERELEIRDLDDPAPAPGEQAREMTELAKKPPPTP